MRVETHIKNSKTLFCLCNKSKLLYNKAMYLCRQHFFKNETEKDTLKSFLFYYDLYEMLKESDEYKDLPAKASQQTLKLVDKSWKSFRKSIIAYHQNKNKFKGKPRIPGYKKSDYQVFIIPMQGVSYKKGLIKIPKTNYIFKTKIEKQQIKEVRLIPFYGKIKIQVVYQEKEKLHNKTLDDNNYIGIDLGVNNLMSIASNQNDIPTFLINGRTIKSINQFYNKTSSIEKSKLKTTNNSQWSKKLNTLLYKRNQAINDYFHKASRFIINICIEMKVKNIVIGKNKGWKQNVKIGKRNNQNFVSIPYEKLIEMVKYKAEEVGINVILTEESYTSKIDHLNFEKLGKQKNYKGERIKRGLFQSSMGKTINADVNGSIGILRKVIGDSFLNKITNRGLVYNPFKVCFI